MAEQFINNIDFNKALSLASLIEVKEGRVTSKTFVNRDDLKLTLFAFDTDEGLSTHAAPGDAMVIALEGKVSIIVGENKPVTVEKGEAIVMPANIPHSLKALEPFKMLLTVVKP